MADYRTPADLKAEIRAALPPTGPIPTSPTERKLLGDAAEAVVGYPDPRVPWTHPAHHAA